MTTERNAQGVDGLAEVMGLLRKATPGEWPQPVPSRFNTDHWVVERPSAPHIAAIKRREDAEAAVAAVNYLRSHGEAIRELVEAAARANGGHTAPHDCYATGPLTGDPFRDLVSCPGCELAAALAKFTEPRP